MVDDDPLVEGELAQRLARADIAGSGFEGRAGDFAVHPEIGTDASVDDEGPIVALVKSRDNRGRYSSGNGRKLAEVEVHIGMERAKHFARGTNGVARLRNHKDRIGGLPHPLIGELHLASDPNTFAVTWEIRPPAATDAHEPKAFRPAFLMERVSRYLEHQTEPVSRTTVEKDVQGDGPALRTAMDRLVIEEYAASEDGVRGAKLLTSVKPYREADDPVHAEPHEHKDSDPVQLRPHPVPTPSKNGDSDSVHGLLPIRQDGDGRRGGIRPTRARMTGGYCPRADEAIQVSPDAARREKDSRALSLLKSFSRQRRPTGMPWTPDRDDTPPPLEGRPGGQIDSRSAFAAACRRSLTSASSRAAISIRSCCASERSCWRSARFCSLSARSLLSLSRSSIAATVRVRSATCTAMLARSSSVVTPARVFAENLTPFWGSDLEI